MLTPGFKISKNNLIKTNSTSKNQSRQFSLDTNNKANSSMF